MQNDLLEKLHLSSVSGFFSATEKILEENETIKVGVALLKIAKFVVLLVFELCGKGIKATCLKIASKL